MRPALALFVCFALLRGILPAQSWVLKIPGPGLGNPLAVNPLNGDVFYAAAGGNRVYVSRDRGYTWMNYGALVTGGGIVKSVSVNSADTLQMVVGVESSVGIPDRVMKTTDGGLTWVETWSGTFSYYGQPVEFSPLHPDTLYTMGLDTLFRSVDFGSTWDTVCAGKGFNAWCDAAIRPDSAAVMYIGDNLSGIWKTRDHGVNWRKVYSTLGEIPSIAIDPFDPRVAYAGKFGGGGGIVRSTDWGETWHNLTVPSGNRDTWWVTCSITHPGYVYYGTYTGDTAHLGIYLSRDSGTTWTKMNEGLTSGGYFNYGLLAADTLAVLALQSNGLYRYQHPATITLVQPNGGEALLADSEYVVAWTASGIYRVRIDYSLDDGATWHEIADSIPAGQGQYPWTTPDTVAPSCRIRVSDALFTTASDQSDSAFTITDAYLTVVSPNGGEAWDAGSARTIAWTAVSFDSLTVEYSVDGGAGWTYVTEAPAAAGELSWTVPDVPTALALVRLRRSDDTTVADVSDAAFTILSVREFSAGVRIADEGGSADTLAFGLAAGATDGIDPWLGEFELPASPPGVFRVSWRLEGTNGLHRDYRDTLLGPWDVRRYIADIEAGPPGHPFHVGWNPDSIRTGVALLSDAATGGDVYNLPMRRDSALTVANPAILNLEIALCGGLPVTIHGTGAWELISVPVETGDRRAGSLFPLSRTGAYAYGNGYVKRDTLRRGEGYWIRTETWTLTGCPESTVTAAVRQGWNIVGGPSVAVPVGDISSFPDSIVGSPFYGYGAGGYFVADSLRPGEGYWVKCNDSGAMMIGTAPGAVAGFAKSSAIPPLPPRRNSITIASAGASSMLIFGPARSGMSLEAPPPPPGGTFSAHFQNGEIGIFQDDSSNYPIEYEIRLNGAGNKIFFSWNVEIQENFDYILVEKLGTQEVSATPLGTTGGIVVSSSPESRFSLRVLPRGNGGDEVPARFSIGRWYPNPFNPSTRVSISLPAASEVSFRVYDVLGGRVASPPPHVYSAGEHLLEWSGLRDDGSSPGSGIYFIVLTVVPEGGVGGPGTRTNTTVGKVALVR